MDRKRQEWLTAHQEEEAARQPSRNWMWFLKLHPPPIGSQDVTQQFGAFPIWCVSRAVIGKANFTPQIVMRSCDEHPFTDPYPFSLVPDTIFPTSYNARRTRWRDGYSRCL